MVGAALSRVFTATTSGGDIWASAALTDVGNAQDEFGRLVMGLLSKVDDPPLHLDLVELAEGKEHHFASVRFDYPGTWEIVEPDEPYRRQPGMRIDPNSYVDNDPKSLGYRRA